MFSICVSDLIWYLQVAHFCASLVEPSSSGVDRICLADALELVDHVDGGTNKPLNKAFWTWSVLKACAALHGAHWLLTQLACALPAPASDHGNSPQVGVATRHFLKIWCTPSFQARHAE